MSYHGLSILAVVPARGGSKSIPRKNLAKVGGQTLLSRAASVCHSLDWIDHSVLSTDDSEIAAVGLAAGLEVPFARPSELAGDLSSSVEMWRHAWLACENIYGHQFDASILLEPSSPMRTPTDVEDTLRTMIESSSDSAVTVSRTPAHYTPHKTLLVDPSGSVTYYLPNGYLHDTRQTIPPYYHRNGICYALLRPTLIDHRKIIGDRCKALVTNRVVVNIDHPIDLQFCDFLIHRI